MSAQGCPFWCQVHDREGVTVAERPHEAIVATASGDGGELVSLSLLQDAGQRQARFEVDLDGHTAEFPLEVAQTLISGLRELYGMAQRSGASA